MCAAAVALILTWDVNRPLRLIHTTRFSDCDCYSFYRNKWFVQESMEATVTTVLTSM